MHEQPEIRDYMKAVEVELDGIDKSQRKAILRDIGGHLDERIGEMVESSGSEALSPEAIRDVLDGFGAPAEIAEEYRHQMLDSHRRRPSGGRRMIPIIAVGVVVLMLAACIVFFLVDPGDKEGDNTILEGVGTEGIQIGDNYDKIIDRYGKPESESETDTHIWVVYRVKKGMDFLLSKNTGGIVEMRFNPGYSGSLGSGVTLGSDLDSVLDSYEGALRIARTNQDGLNNFIYGSNRVLYEVVDDRGNVTAYKFVHAKSGILFWFDTDKLVTQIVIYKPWSGIPNVTSQWLDMMRTGITQERIIGIYGEPEKKVDANGTVWMVYHAAAGVDLLLDNTTREVLEVRFNDGFDYATVNGISIGSSMDDALEKIGGANDTVKSSFSDRKNLAHGVDRILYEQVDGDNKTMAYMFINAPDGFLFWCDKDRTVTQMVVFEAYI